MNEVAKAEKKIPLMEVFGPTIQGEGFLIGTPTFFLRFGLCDYKCTMCDSMHAVDPKQVKANAMWLTQDEIFQHLHTLYQARKPSPKHVVLSGGNPCIHDLKELCLQLVSADWSISVETQGTFYPPWLWHCDSICVSPKGPGMGEKLDIDALDDFLKYIHTHPNLFMKVVIFDQRDLEVASMLYERYKGTFTPDKFFLSLGNPYPPGSPNAQVAALRSDANIFLRDELCGLYLSLWEDIQRDRNLCKVRFLPQLHVLLWGNKQGV